MSKIRFFLFIFLLTSCFQNKKDEHSSSKNYFSSDQISKDGLSSSYAIIKTTYGSVQFKFYPERAPNTSKRIAELIDSGFYDGLKFHRVIENFAIQTGSPDNSLNGGSGLNLKAELSEAQHLRGTVSMARLANDIDSADSQFFICLKNLPELDQKYTVFGQVVKGLEVIDQIKKGDRIISIELIK